MPINYKEYHPKWKLISRLIRFTRAKNQCEWCGAINSQPHPITRSKVVLTVAHIDRNKDNNRFWNLAALCQRCHLKHDVCQHVNNRKYGKHWKKHQINIFTGELTIKTPIDINPFLEKVHNKPVEYQTPFNVHTMASDEQYLQKIKHIAFKIDYRTIYLTYWMAENLEPQHRKAFHELIRRGYCVQLTL